MTALRHPATDDSLTLLAGQSIAVDGQTAAQILDTLVAAAAARHDLPYKFMREKLARQSAGIATMLGGGVMLTHLRMPRLLRPFTIVGHVPRLVPLGIHEGAADLFVLTVSPYRDVAGHLRRLARLTRLLRDADLLVALRAGTPSARPRLLETQAA